MGEQRVPRSPTANGARAARRHRRGCARFRSSRPLRRVGRIAGYVAVAAKGEIDPSPALAEAARAGRRGGVAAGRPEPPRLRFHRADAAPLVPGRFGLMEPAASAPEVAARRAGRGHRPGVGVRRRGAAAGVRRRLLRRRVRRRGRRGPSRRRARRRRAALIGLGYDFQIVARCPAGRRRRAGRSGGDRGACAAARGGEAMIALPVVLSLLIAVLVIAFFVGRTMRPAALPHSEAEKQRLIAAAEVGGGVAQAAGGARRQGARRRRRARRSTPS